MFLYLIISILVFVVCSNLIVNGGFQQPSILDGYSFSYSSITGWTGHFSVQHFGIGIGYNQYIDTSTLLTNGNIQQQVNLPSAGQYILSFYMKAQSTDYNSCRMEIYWNGMLLLNKIPNTTATTLETLILYGQAGNNVLNFRQMGSSFFNNDGMLLDQVTLIPKINNTTPNITNSTSNATTNTTTNTTTNITTNTTTNTTINTTINITTDTTIDIQIPYKWQISTASTILGLPFNKVVSVRYAYLFFQDLWLYKYGDVDYKGVVQAIFDFNVQIQFLKSHFYNDYLRWEQYKFYIGLSDHVPFTRSKFLEIEGSSSVLIDCNLSYFIYTIPLNILTVSSLNILFKMLAKYKVSVLLRKYSFFLETFSQILLQGNIVYFTYVCLSHLKNSWAIKFVDKAALVLTMTMLFFICIFCLTFYFLVGRHKQKACYFIYNFYRCHHSYVYLTVKNILRNFGRGAIFFYLHYQYPYKLLFLGIVELVIILLALSIHLNEQIFISKTAFSLELCFHLLFMIFNMSLYFQYFCEQNQIVEVQQLSLQWQELLIVLLVSIIALIMALDFVPLQYFKRLDVLNNFFKGIQDNEKINKRGTEVTQGKVRKKLQQMISRAEIDENNQPQQKNIIKLRVKIKQKVKLKPNLKLKSLRKQKLFTLRQRKNS